MSDSSEEEFVPNEEPERKPADYQAVGDLWSDDMLWNVRSQAQKSAFNIMLQLDLPKTVPAFVYAARLCWEAAITYSIVHGFAELTDKGTASLERIGERQADDVNEYLADVVPLKKDEEYGGSAQPEAYL